MFCTQCSHEIRADDKFCPQCGAPVVHQSDDDTNNASASKKKRKQKPRTIDKINARRATATRSQSAGFSKSNLVLMAIVAVVVVFALKEFYITTDNTHIAPSTTAPRNDVPDANVMAVASKFICACGTCGETSLETCTCPTAKKEREFIRSELATGKTVAQAVTSVSKLFGHLKTDAKRDSVEVGA